MSPYGTDPDAQQDLRLYGSSDEHTITLNWDGPRPGDGWYEVIEEGVGQVHKGRLNSFQCAREDGAYTFYVVAVFYGGGVLTSNTAQVHVDTGVPPTPVLEYEVDSGVVNLYWQPVDTAVFYETIVNGGTLEQGTSTQAEHAPWETCDYVYQVRAQNAAGRWSPYSNQVVYSLDNSPPAAPEVTAYMSVGNQVQLSWQYNDRATAYAIRRNGVDLDSSNVDVNMYMDQVPAPGPYSYRVRAKDQHGRWGLWSEQSENSSVYVI